MPENSEYSSNFLKLESLIEDLAAVEHERWSHWQRHLHSKCERMSDGSLVIPANLADHWESQMNTSYSELPEAEKESDREQVRRYLPVITRALAPDHRELFIDTIVADRPSCTVPPASRRRSCDLGL